MGVHGLWKLIDAAGKPVPVETLENKILAVDVSIWLHQLVKGFQDAGGSGANPHLLGLFYRICKLLFFRIKPVFVFDGGVPALKRNTINARQSNRSKASDSLEKVRQDLLQNLLKQHALGKLLGQNVKIPKTVTSKQDSMFFLPPVPSSSTEKKPEEASSSWGDFEEESLSSEEEASSSSFEELSPRKKYRDIHSIDVKSKEFKELPADIRHDILTELKETRKQNSWAKVHLMPEDVGDFSSFQMDRLLKRRSVQVGLEEAEKEMGPRCFTVSEIQEILEYQGVDVTQQSQRIASDSSTRVLYTNQKKEPDKEKSSKLKTIVESMEELDSDVDDPLIDTLKANEDMSQEEILCLIREEETKKKVRDLVDCGKSSKSSNELSVDEIRREQTSNLDPGKSQIEPTSKKQITFDNKQVSKLLKESAQKNLIPISKMDKVLDGRKRKMQRKKVVRKVTEKEPNLSESSSDSDVPDKKRKQSSDSSSGEDEPVLSETLQKKNISVEKIEEKSNKKINISESSDDDFEEVQNISKVDSNSSDDFINVTTPNKNKIIKKDLTTEKTDVSIELKFEKPPSDEEDIFADIFTNVEDKNKPNKSNVAIKSENKTPEKSKTVSIKLNLDKPPSDEEDIFADIFTNIEDKNKPNKSNVVVKSENKTPNKSKTVSIKLNLDKPPSDEEDIFADVFQAPQKTSPSPEKKFVPEAVMKKEIINEVEKKPLSIEIDLKKAKSDEEDIFADVFEKSKIKSTEKSENLLKVGIDEKETDRAVILEELLLTKKKLEEELNTSDVDEPVNFDRKFSSDEELEEVKEEKAHETQESLEEKKYFSDDKLVLEKEEKPEQKSPNSFAKKLATVEQVRQFQSTLERESSSLIKEKRANEKIAATISEQITVEAQELLRLFGIPYLIAPMEAEAQCAFLDLHGLTQGTITDDSDIWLFGASNVYKNFFDQKKFVKLFKSSDIRKVYNLGRDELIMLGLLVGSDYTSGLNGVGPVTALEIVADFPEDNDDMFPPRDRLSRFASAFSEHKLPRKLMKKLMAVQLIEGFPSLEVVKAYTDPQVDESEETFSWGSPDMERIRDYAMNKFGWDPNKTDKTLEPIIDKLKQNKTQMTLHGFFDWAFEDVQNKMSRRVEAAVSLLGTSPTKRTQEEEVDDPPKEIPKKRAKKDVDEKKTEPKRKPRKTKSTINEGGSSSEAVSSSSLAGPSSEPGPSISRAGPSSGPLSKAGPSGQSDVSQYLNDEDAAVFAAFMDDDDSSLAGPSPFDQFMSSSEPSTSSNANSKKKNEQPKNNPQLVATLPRVNATIEKLRKGKSLSAKPRTRVARESVSLFKPQSELNFDAPFGSGETRKRKKVQRTDEEKWKEIEEARAKAARVIAKLKNVDQFHSNV